MANQIKPSNPNEIDETYSGFEDWLYPDNDNRRKRCDQLMSQCADMVNEIADMKIYIEKEMDLVNKYINDAYKSIGSIPEQKKISISPDFWVTMIPHVAAVSIFTAVSGFTYKIGERLAVTYLLKNGKIGQAALTKLVGLPKWLKFATGAGSAVGGALAAIGIEVLIDAITGANTRSKLQTAIKDLAEPRLELKYVHLQASYIKDSLKSTLLEIKKVQKDAIDKSYTKEQLDKEMKDRIKSSLELNQVLSPAPTVKDALKELNKKDELLKAWTEEDQKDPQIVNGFVKKLEVKYKESNHA